MNTRHCAVRAERNMPMTNAHVGPTIPLPEEPMQVSEYRYLLRLLTWLSGARQRISYGFHP